MPNPILDGLSLVDATGRMILAANGVVLLAAIVGHLVLRSRYTAIRRELERSPAGPVQFSEPVLNRIVRDTINTSRSGSDDVTQAIIEDAFQAELRPLLLAERFVRAATGLVLVLGLLGTFYGLTLSIGKLAHLVSADSGAVADVTTALTRGLTEALEGMAVAFSNSLVGVGSAVVLTLLGVVNNVTDLRTGLMVQAETFAARVLSRPAASLDDGAGLATMFVESVARLERTVARFEAALQSFAENTNDLREVQLVVALRPRDARGGGNLAE